MWQIKSVLDAMFDLLIWPFRSIDPVWSLLFLSLLTAILILLVFRYTSDQKGIKETKDKIKAHLLEIRIFKDSLKIQLSAQKKLLTYNAIYMKHTVKPLLFMILPVALLVIQMDAWYGRNPLTPEESTIFSVVFADSVSEQLPSDIIIEVSDGLTIETPLLRIQEAQQLNWRIRANKPGTHQVTVRTPKTTYQKAMVVADGKLRRISAVSVNSGLWQGILSPGVKAFSKNLPLKKIEIRYPSKSIDVFGLRTHWLIFFLVFTTVIAFALKSFLKVEI